MMQMAPSTGAPPPGPELRDIHLPPEPSWWPPAPGWWVLGALLLALLLVGIWWWRGHRRVRHRRQRVLRELDHMVLQHQHDGDASALASGLQQLLRRVARQHDTQATRQRGDAWRRTLARVPIDASSLQYLQALDERIYQPSGTFDHAAAVAAVRQWLRLALKPSAWKPAEAEQPDG